MSTNSPNHKNLMTKSILCTVIYCLIIGLIIVLFSEDSGTIFSVCAFMITIFCCPILSSIAIIRSYKSNKLYNSALLLNDETQKETLLAQSAKANEKAQFMIKQSVTVGIIWAVFSLMPYVLLFVN